MERMKRDVLSSLSSIKCSVQEVKLDEKALSKPLQPPCLAQALKQYIDSKDRIERLSRQLEPTIVEMVKNKISEYRSLIVEMLRPTLGVDEEHINVLIDKIIRVLADPRIYLYPIAFLPLYMCLHWHESGGRYPDRVAEVGIDKVCEDIAFVESAMGAVSDLVNTLSSSIIALYENI